MVPGGREITLYESPLTHFHFDRIDRAHQAQTQRQSGVSRKILAPPETRQEADRTLEFGAAYRR